MTNKFPQLVVDHHGDSLAMLVTIASPLRIVASEHPLNPNGEEDLQRLAACWNTLDGVATEELQSGKFKAEMAMLMQAHDVAQRDLADMRSRLIDGEGTTVVLKITDADIAFLLSSALESTCGSQYWASVSHVALGAIDGAPWGNDYTPTYIRAPFCTDGFVTITESNDEDNQLIDHKLDRAALQRGLQAMAEKHPQHFGNFRAEAGDATTGDVFLQCCLFGEVKYG